MTADRARPKTARKKVARKTAGPERTGAILGPDGLRRCAWAASNPVSRLYHDTEWGTPVHGERALLERICLEGFQSGLSWLTILNKRPAFRAAFHDFDADAVSRFTELPTVQRSVVILKDVLGEPLSDIFSSCRWIPSKPIWLGVGRVFARSMRSRHALLGTAHPPTPSRVTSRCSI